MRDWEMKIRKEIEESLFKPINVSIDGKEMWRWDCLQETICTTG